MIKYIRSSFLISLGAFVLSGPILRTSEEVKPAVNIRTIHSRADEAIDYCRANEFNTDYCILIDMSIHSGIKRFFVWDFVKDTIAHSFLVGHGCGDKPWGSDWSKDKPVFSNEEGSHCSSLGKYKIGRRGYSQWGINIKYTLHGLESTNSNAFDRFVVLHSWGKIPDNEVYPQGAAEGWGCPVLSDNSLRIIDPILKDSSLPVLMWMYE